MTDSIEMTICPQCGHLVPRLNIEIHLASACGRVSRSVTADHIINRNTDISTLSTDLSVTNSSSQAQTTVALPIADDDADHNIHLIQPSSSPTANVDKQWTCPQCTLFNPLNSHRCDACDYAYSEPDLSMTAHSSRLITEQSSDHSTRPPDPIQYRQQLIQSSNHEPDFSINSSSLTPTASMRFVGGGALIGSLLGAAGAYIRGRNVASSMMEGAMTGVLGGVIARDALLAASPSLRSSQDNNIRQESTRPTRLVSITRRRYPDGTVETICEENGVRVVDQRQSGDVNHETNLTNSNPFMMAQTPLLHAISTTQNQNRTLLSPSHRIRIISTASGSYGYSLDDIDGMDYERLLDIFGDGSDRNRVADESMIRRLPTTTLKNVDDELPKDREHRLCSICLEEFVNGQTRKMLPCLHGFHDTCIDRWLLHSNASCPICKHSLYEPTHRHE